jgi:pSer/pThr/pTyr-binding forkhead associated (FHA) protein
MFTLIIEDRYGAIVDEYSFEDGEFVIGRSQSCDIVLAADNVSRRHARLFTVEGRCYIEDLNAANGVWLNGKRIYNVTELPRSAQVRIGDFFLHIEGAAFSHPMGPATYARLIPMHGSAGGPFELNRPTTLVGRGKDCAIVIHDASVSRIHSKLTLDAGRVVVEDLRSSNGTWVNDRRVDSIELRHGDRLRFGTVGFQYLVDGQDAPSTDPAAAWPASPPTATDAPADATAFRSAAPISSFGADYPEYYQNEQPASMAQGRSWLPHIAIVAVFALAATLLVVVVGFAYDRFLGPELPPRPVAAAPATPKVDEKAEDKRRFEELLARGRDAIASRQWDQAEEIFKDARRIDPIGEEPTRALNRIATEKRAGKRFLRAEEAFKAKDYAEAIRQHRLIPESSVYRADASAALKAIAGILEIDGDAECAAKREDACRERYTLALSTEFASEELEKKYAKLLKPDGDDDDKGASSNRRRRRRHR